MKENDKIENSDFVKDLADSKLYDFGKIEEKWSKKWAESDYGRAPDDSDKPKFYSLIEFPYPSGEGLHVGHCMMYAATDAHARMKRMQGFNVMFPIGWDAFGLPTENYAIKNKINPKDASNKNISNFKRQQIELGCSFDWSREIDTTDPKYYKWTQWIFLQFYKHAIVDGKLIEVADDDTVTPRLAFQAEMPVNWCPSCKINLANEEVIGGKCERCETETEKRMQKQWMLRITAYADRLISDLETVDYLDYIKKAQINWIGKSNGATIRFNLKSHPSRPMALSGLYPAETDKPRSETSNLKNMENNLFIEVFTTRADTLFGCTFMAISPEHKMLKNNELKITNYAEVKEYVWQAKKKSDLERTDLAKDKTGVELKGIKAINPINNEEIPIFVADYVLSGYGTGAVMCVPAHDERDFEFAKKYGIEIKKVISTENNQSDAVEQPSVDFGRLINSSQYNELESADAARKITEKLKEMGVGDFAVNYKLRDWIFSRQHYWGEPIPIIYCRKCWETQMSNVKCQNCGSGAIIDGKEYMIVPVPEDQLPLELPPVKNYEPTDTGESPLAKIDDWVNTICPKCGGKALRETDTMPNWAGSSWYFLRYCDPKNDNEFASLDKLKHWMPVDLYNGGNEHTNLHLLYSRFWHKFLFDLGKVTTSEPYQKRISHGIILGTDGQKMSKSRGNTISPDEMIEKFGADTLRAYMMFIGPYDQESAWNMNGIQGVYRFIVKIWDNVGKASEIKTTDNLNLELNKIIKFATIDIEKFSFNTYIAKLMEFNNILLKEEKISKEVLKKFTILFSPAIPHLAEEVWQMLGEIKSIFEQKWPEFDQRVITSEQIEIPIQVNGKVRDRIHVSSDIADEELKKLALETKKIIEFLGGKEPKKVIVVSKRLVSIVI